jgi:CBS domain-containing protein
MVVASDLMTKSYPKVDVKDTVSSWIGMMKKKHLHSALVFEGKKFIGVVDRDWLRTSKIDPAKTKIGNVVKRRSKSKTSVYVPKLSPQTGLVDVCRLIDTSAVHMLPVMDGAKVLGVVDVWHVLESLKPEYKGVKVEELATRKVISCKPTDSIGYVLRLMFRKDIGRVPVVDKVGRLVGFVSLSDIGEEYHAPRKRLRLPQRMSHMFGKKTGADVGEKHKLLELPVEHVMTTSREYACKPSDSVVKAIKLLCDDVVSSVIVLESRKPVGILTARDIMRDASVRLRDIGVRSYTE